MSDYEISHYEKLPLNLQGGMKRYVEDGIQAGHFLTAVLSNDLVGAISRADPKSLEALPDIVRWVYNEVPHKCWGSEEKVKNWRGEKNAYGVRSTHGT